MEFKLKYYRHYLLTLALLSMAAQVCFAQIEFTEHSIAGDLSGARSVYAVDIDGDGDMDVLGASYSDGITWWENDGEQDFTEHLITNNFDGAFCIYATDIDGDGDMDVLGAAYGVSSIRWWENDGEQSFTEHTIAAYFNGTRGVYATDVDGDGDMDVLGAATGSHDIAWWKNDGEQDFNKYIIADDFEGAISVYATDIDNDGDIDVLGAASDADDIAWWENDGEQGFTEHTIAGDFDGAISVYATDIDNDGDIDVLGAASGADDITWWENDGEQGFTEHTIAGDFEGAISVYATDFDNDGDIDVLGAASRADDITWWENDGEQDFTEHTIAGDFNLAFSICAADIDNDSDLDVLGASYSDGITWWESDLVRSMISGVVIDSSSGQRLEGAVVATSYGFESITNENGLWQMDRVRMEPFDLTVTMIGYNDLTLVDLEVKFDDTLKINFALLHPAIAPSVERFSAELEIGDSTSIDFTVRNDGNGVLEWSVLCEIPDVAECWSLRQSFPVGDIVNDQRIRGVVFVNDRYYLSGGGASARDDNFIYVLNLDGELLDSYHQLGQARYGMADLAWDGELIWGGSEELIYGFNITGDSVTSFEGPYNDNQAIAWDRDRELLWIAGRLTDYIIGFNREGVAIDSISQFDLMIYGLAYFPDDPDGYPLYVTHSVVVPDADDYQVLHKINPNDNDSMFVAQQYSENGELGGKPEGILITDQLDPYSWVLLSIVNDGADDRFDIYQVDAKSSWMRIEPESGIVNPDEQGDITLFLNATDLESILYPGELRFRHNGFGGEITVAVDLTVSPSGVSGDGEVLPTTFAIASVYPNPFNSSTVISYTLPSATYISFEVYNLLGQQVQTLVEGQQPAGNHRTILTANELSSGLYLVKLSSDNQSSIQKIMLIK